MSSTNAGSIYYDVEMDVKGLLSAQQQVNARLDSMERGFNGTSKAVEGTERSFSSLTKISLALSAAMSVKQITEYATAWVDVNNKLANAVKTNESLAEVTSRVFDIAQSTKSDLQSTAALYGTLERSTRSLGLSSNDLSSVIKTVNEGLVLSGATTQEAAGATLQLSQALASGALRGDEFNSVSENGSRLAQALADSLGVNIGQLKVMAGQGKLTSDVVINGLLSQGATIAQEFNNHTTTLAQSLQIAGNNLTKFFGENTTVNSFLSAAGSGIVMLSEHIGALSSVLTAGALIMGSRYVSALAMSASASIKESIATVQQTKATADAARASVLRAQLEVTKAAAIKYSASVEVAAAAAQARSATTSDEVALAQGRLSAARLAMIDATVAETAATNELTAAQKASATASAAAGGIVKTALGGAMSLVGGPVGVIALAATALYMWHQNAEQAKKSANDLADSVGDLGRQFKTMSDTQLSATIAKLNQSLPSLTEQSNDAEIAFKNATYRVNKLQEGIDKYGLSSTIGKNNAAAMQGALDNQSEAAANLDDAQRRLSQTQSLINLGRAQLNGTLQQGLDLLSRENTQVGVADGLYRKFGQALNIAAQAKQNFNSQSLTMQRPPDADDYLDQLKSENDLLAIQDLRQRAIAKGRLDFQNKMKSSKDQSYLDSSKYQADIDLAGQLAACNYDEQKSNAARQKQQKAGVTTANQQARAEESVTQKLDQLRQQSDLNAVSSQNLTLEQTKLRAEMSLGKNATAAQREEAAKYAEAIWQQAAALKARNLIPEVAENDDYQSKTAQLELLKGQRDAQGNLIISQQQYQQESEKLASEHIGNLAKINSQNAVTPQQSLAGQVDPVQQLANENAEKLSLINQYEQAGVLAHGQAAALKQAQDTKYNQDSYDAMWNLWKSQSQINQLMGAGIDTLSSGSASALSGIITGTESAGEAFRNLANGALNAMLEQLIKVGIQAMLVRTVLGSFMGGVSSISSPSVATPSLNTGALGLSSGWQSYVSGARKNGGPVNGSGLYRVGESGKPEIFQASNGSQYMIPGDNGKVISNRNMATSVSAGSSGSLNIDLGGITVNLPSSSNQPASSVDANGIGKQIQQSVVNAINDQVNRQGTPLWRAINGR